IFHRSLSIDENSQFEGSSRRVENPTEIPSSIDANVPQTEDIQSPTPASNIDADLQRVESTPSDWSESTVGPRQYGLPTRPCGALASQRMLRRANVFVRD